MCTEMQTTPNGKSFQNIKITAMRYKAVRTHVHLFVLHYSTTWCQPGLS